MANITGISYSCQNDNLNAEPDGVAKLQRMLVRVFGEFPLELNKDHIPKLDVLIAIHEMPDANPYQRLRDLLVQHGRVRLDLW